MNPLLNISGPFLAERERWSLWAPAILGAGILVYFWLSFEPPFWLLAATPLLMAAAYLLRQRWTFFLAASVLALFAAGFNAAQLETKLVEAPMLERPIGPTGVTGRLVLTEALPEGVRVTLKDPVIGRLEPEETPKKVRIKLNNRELADIPPAGTRIDLWAQLEPLSDPVMPGAADFRRLGYFKQLGGVGWAYGKIKPAADGAPLSWRDEFGLAFERARRALADHVYAQLSGDVAAMTAARLNGEQSAISEPVISPMRIAGLAHLLSTSGFHVTIMALLVYFPLRFLFALVPALALRYPIKKWAAFGAILSATGYTLLVGSPAATLRSLLMTGIAMLAVLVDRRSAPMRLVVLSAALVMLIEPDALLGPSFQMSFAAVFCLIAYNERAFGWAATGDLSAHFEGIGPEWLRGFGHYLWVIARTSLIATAATTPFALYHFGTFSFYGFIANMLAIPLTSFWVMPCILMAYIAVPFGLDKLFILGAGKGIALTIWIAETVAGWPYSIFYLPAMPAFVLGMLVVGGLWLCLWKRNWRWLGLIPVFIGALYPFYTPKPDFMVLADGKEWATRLDDGRLAISNLDREKFAVGQWQERLGMPETVDVFQLPPDFDQLRCDDLGCVYHKEGKILAMPALESAALEDCEKADGVIAPFSLKDCQAPLVIGDFELWRHGSYAIYFKGGNMRVTYSREKRGERPWSVGWRNTRNGGDNGS